MNREDVIRMAREAGSDTQCFQIWPPTFRRKIDFTIAELERFAALVAAAERQKRKESEMMAECMDMVRQELIAAGLVESSVPPMMLPEAIFSAHRAAVAAERESCAQVCEEMAQHWADYKDTALLNGDVQLSNAASGEPRAANALAELIRSRGNQ